MNDLPPGFIQRLAHALKSAAQRPTRCVGAAAVIAPVAASVLSDQRSCTTGANLRLDGGVMRDF